MDNDRYLWLVTSKPDPAREEEYNKWYDKHVETFFKFPPQNQPVFHHLSVGGQIMILFDCFGDILFDIAGLGTVGHKYATFKF